MRGVAKPAFHVLAHPRARGTSLRPPRASVSNQGQRSGALVPGSPRPLPACRQPRPEGGDRAEQRALLRLLPTRCCPGCRRRMCLAPPPRPWIPLPLRSRCSRSRLQAPRRLRSPWPGPAGCSGRCSGAAAATAAAAGAPAPPACLFTPPPAPSPRVSRGVAACCCCSGPLRPPPLTRGASRPGLRPPGGWRGLLPRPPLPPPRPRLLTRPCVPLCYRSRWRRPRTRRGATARYVGAARVRAQDPSPVARARFRAPPRAPRVHARGSAARAAQPPPPPPSPRPPSPPIGPQNKGRSPRPWVFSLFCSLESLVGWAV